MSRTNFQELLDAGVHFGHLARKWNPKMAPYIFDQKNGIHIIDLHKTVVKVDEAAEVMKELAKSGRKILFVATKKQAKDIVSEKAAEVTTVTEAAIDMLGQTCSEVKHVNGPDAPRMIIAVLPVKKTKLPIIVVVVPPFT